LFPSALFPSALFPSALFPSANHRYPQGSTSAARRKATPSGGGYAAPCSVPLARAGCSLRATVGDVFGGLRS